MWLLKKLVHVYEMCIFSLVVLSDIERRNTGQNLLYYCI